MFNLRGVINFFVFDPQDAKTLYAHATGLWRSTDSGEHWNLVYPNPSAVKGVKMNSDHSDEDIIADPDPLGQYRPWILIRPTRRFSTLRQATRSHHQFSSLTTLVKAGRSRPNCLRCLGACGSIPLPRGYADDISCGPEEHCSGEWFRSSETAIGFRLQRISLGFQEGAKPILYATSQEGAFISKDGGASWQKISIAG